MGEISPVMMKRCDEILGTGRAGINRQSISETLRDHVYTTTSGIFTAPPFQAAVDTFGIDNMMFSVDYPFARNEEGRHFLNGLALSAADKQQLASGNAQRILRIADTFWQLSVKCMIFKHAKENFNTRRRPGYCCIDGCITAPGGI